MQMRCNLGELPDMISTRDQIQLKFDEIKIKFFHRQLFGFLQVQ